MPYYNRDPKRDHNFGNHPCVASANDRKASDSEEPSPKSHWPHLGCSDCLCMRVGKEGFIDAPGILLRSNVALTLAS